MREGDIYRWRWADEDQRDLGSFGAYHCCSRWAVFRNGKLMDTYWAGFENKILSAEKVELTLVANEDELREIASYETPYYRPSDIVDMRHANNSHGPIYLRNGAEKDAATMLSVVRSKKEEAERVIRFATDQIARCAEMEEQIAKGNLSEVYL